MLLIIYNTEYNILNDSKGSYIFFILLFTDTTVRVESPTEAEVEEKEGLAIWNVVIPKIGDIQGESVHWRRGSIIRQGDANSDGL